MRRRARKKHVQLELLNQKGTAARSNRGGKRRGAGRKPRGSRSGTSHARRPKITASMPMHITFRVERSVGSLRQPERYVAVRKATIVAAKHLDVRIVQLSIQRNHLHLLVEADDRKALTRGMKSFAVSAAKRINACTMVDGKRRRGRVFSDRYHIEQITNRYQAFRALSYVLNNWRKHREDFDRDAQEWYVDPYSSATSFSGWKERIPSWEPSYEPLCVREPRSWLLRQGWEKYGPVSCFDVPSRMPKH